MLKPKALGLTIGIFWALVVVWSIMIGLVGKGTAAFECINSFYFGLYSLSWLGLILGTIIGFIDGFVFGFLFGWVYNKLAA